MRLHLKLFVQYDTNLHNSSSLTSVWGTPEDKYMKFAGIIMTTPCLAIMISNFHNADKNISCTINSQTITGLYSSEAKRGAREMGKEAW